MTPTERKRAMEALMLLTEEKWYNQQKIGIQWKANKKMDDKRGFSKSNRCLGEYFLLQLSLMQKKKGMSCLLMFQMRLYRHQCHQMKKEK